jgi:flagellar FliL protein
VAEEETVPGTDEQDAAPAGKSKIVLMATLALLVLGGAGAAWFFLFSGGDDATDEGETVEQAEQRPPQGPVTYQALSPSFIVNFPHQGRQRYLQAELTVMSRDPAALAAVRQHMPVIRHNLITLFNAQLLLVFEDPTGVETLRQLATEEVQRILQEEIGRPGIEEVLFTTFVMQ